MQNSNNFYLEVLLKGDSKEIQNIYKNNFFKVRKFVLQNKGQQQDAEDIFQRALMQLTVRYKKEKFEIKSTFEGYVFIACKNLWRRELNKSKLMVTSGEVFTLVDEEKDMALALIEQKKWEMFQDGLNKISANCKEILKMFFEKISYSEMVKKMQYNSEAVARQRVFKCKAKLKEIIQSNKEYLSNEFRG